VENLYRFLVDQPGLAALHMLTSDNNRSPGVVGFGAEDPLQSHLFADQHRQLGQPVFRLQRLSECNRDDVHEQWIHPAAWQFRAGHRQYVGGAGRSGRPRQQSQPHPLG
jgi:hypothetical protein